MSYLDDAVLIAGTSPEGIFKDARALAAALVPIARGFHRDVVRVALLVMLEAVDRQQAIFEAAVDRQEAPDD